MIHRARLVRWGVGAAWLVVAVTAVAPAAAAPSCPPFALERSWLAVMAKEGPALTPAQARVLAQSGAIFGYPVGVLPPRGPAPLTVGVVWIERPSEPRAIEFDADGDGVPEIVDTRQEAFGHTYRTPGRYAATISVRNGDGSVVTYRSPVTVLTQEAFDAELRDRWDALKAALRERSVEAALHCFLALEPQRAERAVRPLLGADVEQMLPPLRFVELRGREALYETVRPPAGDVAPLDVGFFVDFDGVWRIAGFRKRGSRP